jgi:ribonuclease J
MQLPQSLFVDDPTTVHVVPIGGCGEFGMNLTFYIYRTKLYVIDCGAMPSNADKLGTELVFPAADAFVEQLGGVHAYVITHGHDDHIGGLPYMWARWPAPIYATAWTADLIRERIARSKNPPLPEIQVVSSGDTVKTGSGISFEYLHVNHSIPMACALVIRFGATTIFHTGDFKFDATPVGEQPIDCNALQRIGDNGVDVVFADSTNAPTAGMCPSESEVLNPMIKYVGATNGSTIVTLFASNLWRVMTLINAARKCHKPVLALGRRILNSIELGERYQFIANSQDVVLTEDDAKNVPQDGLLVLCSGSQGEWGSALHRLSNNEHKAYKISDQDQIIFSSRTIPGNERQIAGLVDSCLKLGAKIVMNTSGETLHVSGHAYRGDITMLLKLLRPSVYVPIHGTFRNMLENSKIGSSVGIRTMDFDALMVNGKILAVCGRSVTTVGQLERDLNFVDSESYIPMTQQDVKSRLKIGESGLVCISGVIHKSRGSWLFPPTIECRGVAWPATLSASSFGEKLAEHLSRCVIAELDRKNDHDHITINEYVRIAARRFVGQATGKKIVAVPMIHFA